MTLYVKELWRYPVKSLAGERLTGAEITEGGVAGDRQVVIHNGHKLISARTRPGLLGLRGATGDDGSVLIDGRPWDAPESVAAVRRAAGDDARLTRLTGPERFDILPLLVATDGAIAEFGQDGRRLRPNIVVGGVAGLAEREWEGRRLRIGDLTVALDSLRGRCIVTTFDPDTLEQDVGVLQDIRHRFDGTLALNAAVEQAGLISIDDGVELV